MLCTTALRAYIETDDPAAARRVALHIIDNVETQLADRARASKSAPAAGFEPATFALQKRCSTN
jgi:hypothetical protein